MCICTSGSRKILPREVILDLRRKHELELGIERKEEGWGMVSPQNLKTNQKGEGTTGECTGVI